MLSSALTEGENHTKTYHPPNQSNQPNNQNSRYGHAEAADEVEMVPISLPDFHLKVAVSQSFSASKGTGNGSRNGTSNGSNMDVAGSTGSSLSDIDTYLRQCRQERERFRGLFPGDN